MPVASLLPIVTWGGYVACLIYLTVLTVIFVALARMAVRENRDRARDAAVEDFSIVRSSPFTIPVSIIAPAFNEEVCITASIESLLALDYPEYEVIVVNDGSTDGTMRRLTEAFDLEPSAALYRRVIDAAEIRQIYRSRLDPRLTVVDKVNAGKADALNAGTNLARYRYICCVDSDTVYHSDALLKGMRLVMPDPATVVGVTSHVTLHSRPEQAVRDDQGRTRLDRHPLVVFQLLDYLRAFIWARAAWSRWNYMLCSVGAFAIWRRDVVVDLGGFSPRFTCEDIEFTFRVHEHFRRLRLPYRIQALPDPVGITEGPTSIRALVSQRARWQRVIAETVWHYRRMLCNPRYGTVGFVGMPYYVLAEVLAPVFQVLAVLIVPLAAYSGLLRPLECLQMLLIVALGSAAFTCAAVLVQDRYSRTFAAGDLAYLLLLAPADLFLYRPFIFWAQCKGTIDFLLGDRRWNKFERNRRGWLSAKLAVNNR
jgi:cellulose synthase/poly-beta-1,6-N-acetylglucosamine synthase-like glycosyltransferase